jgi:predicted transcriptional regulator
MAAAGLERFPVIESAETHRLIGIVSRSDLVKPRKLIHEEESRRERFFLGPRKAPEPDAEDVDGR